MLRSSYVETIRLSIQLNELTLPDINQLVSVRFVMHEDIIKKLLFTITLTADTKRDFFNNFLKDHFAENTVP